MSTVLPSSGPGWWYHCCHRVGQHPFQHSAVERCRLSLSGWLSVDQFSSASCCPCAGAQPCSFCQTSFPYWPTVLLVISQHLFHLSSVLVLLPPTPSSLFSGSVSTRPGSVHLYQWAIWFADQIMLLFVFICCCMIFVVPFWPVHGRKDGCYPWSTVGILPNVKDW